MILCSSMLIIERSFGPYIFKTIIDVLNDNSLPKVELVNQLWLWCGAFVLCNVLAELSYRIVGFIGAFVYPKCQSNIRSEMLQHIMKYDYSFFIHNFSGEIASKVFDIPREFRYIIGALIGILIPIFCVICVSGFFIWNVSYVIGIIYVIWLISHFTIVYYFVTIGHRKSSYRSSIVRMLQSNIVDIFSNILNINLFSASNFVLKRYFVLHDQEKKINFGISVIFELLKSVLSFNTILGLTTILVFCIISWSNDIISNGDVILVMTSTMNVILVSWWAAFEINNLVEMIASSSDAFSIMQHVYDNYDFDYSGSGSSNKDLVVSEGTIEFNNITLRYSSGKTVFSEQSFVIVGGSKVAIIGSSGSGKTSLLNVIVRVFQLDSGSILIDGQNIDDVSLKSLRDNIAFISQDSVLFHSSLIDNIRFAKPQSSDSEVIEAAEKAYCGDFVSEMEDGYYSDVGERGSKLSGGQRQRVMIARIILKDSPIVILDEAMSAIDINTECIVKKALDAALKDKTVIIVTHKLYDTVNVDKIIILLNGVVVEQGSHKELLEKQGYYFNLWKNI